MNLSGPFQCRLIWWQLNSYTQPRKLQIISFIVLKANGATVIVNTAMVVITRLSRVDPICGSKLPLNVVLIPQLMEV